MTLASGQGSSERLLGVGGVRALVRVTPARPPARRRHRPAGAVPSACGQTGVAGSADQPRLQRTLGERKIDVLLVDPTTVLEPVHRVAQAEGVKLTLDLPGH